MTRSRTQQPGEVPTQHDALYYSQRASAGLIVTEATHISPEGRGYVWTPGIHTEAQRDGWRLVTDAVHNAGGRIFLQLRHVVRVLHSSLQPDGRAPVAPSAIRARATSLFGEHTHRGERMTSAKRRRRHHPTALSGFMWPELYVLRGSDGGASEPCMGKGEFVLPRSGGGDRDLDAPDADAEGAELEQLEPDRAACGLGELAADVRSANRSSWHSTFLQGRGP